MAELNEFERARLENIKKNREAMEAMGVQQAASGLAAMRPEKPTKKPERKVKVAPQKLSPARRSDRNSGRVVNYNEQQALAVYENSRPQRSLKRARSSKAPGSRSGNSRYEAWHPEIPSAPIDAQDACIKAAKEKMEQLTTAKKAAFAKVLMESMVSGGFWLQAPPKLQDHLNVDADITFTTTDTVRPVSCFKFTQAGRKEGTGRKDAWFVGYLQKKDKKTGQCQGGQGFSKNWRGFTRDLFFHPGDCIVFEVVSRNELKVHVFRAWDYAEDDCPLKPDKFDDIRFKPISAQEFQDADEGTGEGADEPGTEPVEGSPEPNDSEEAEPIGANPGSSNSGAAAKGKSRKKAKATLAAAAAATAVAVKPGSSNGNGAKSKGNKKAKVTAAAAATEAVKGKRASTSAAAAAAEGMAGEKRKMGQKLSSSAAAAPETGNKGSKAAAAAEGREAAAAKRGSRHSKAAVAAAAGAKKVKLAVRWPSLEQPQQPKEEDTNDLSQEVE